MQNVLFPMFVGLGMGLAALAHLVLGPSLALQGLLVVALVIAGTVALQSGGSDD